MNAFLGVSIDTFVRNWLEQLDYSTLCAAVLLFVFVAALVFRVRHGRAPRLGSLLRVAEACGILMSGLLVATVFLFTDPPAVSILSHEARAMAGFSSLLVSLHVSLDTLRTAVWRRRGRDRLSSAPHANPHSPTSA